VNTRTSVSHELIAGFEAREAFDRPKRIIALLREIEADSTFERQPDVGTFADFKRLTT